LLPIEQRDFDLEKKLFGRLPNVWQSSNDLSQAMLEPELVAADPRDNKLGNAPMRFVNWFAAEWKLPVQSPWGS